jgi:hypothetical protein
MIFNFSRKEKIKLDAYTIVGDLIDIIPPTLSKNNLPEWYSRLPKGGEIPNVRHCSGFKDLHNEGILIRAWSDMEIEISPDESVQFDVACKDELKDPIERHDIKNQATGAWPGYTNLKLVSPWWFKCNKPVKWAMLPPVWHTKDPLDWMVVPGMLEFKYQHATNVNLLFKLKSEPFMVRIKAGQPLVHMVPMFDESWELDVKAMDISDWKRHFARWNHSFDLVYQKTRALVQKRSQ